jgi:S-adenosylmethionine:tRNA ribosyltransferase-isomerase
VFEAQKAFRKARETVVATADFEYALPEGFIAQRPAPVRDESRLMVLDRTERAFRHTVFKNLLSFLEKGDILVLNDTRVIPARLRGIKEETGARIEILLLRERADNSWEVLSRPERRVKAGGRISFNGGRLKVLPRERLGRGKWLVNLEYRGDLYRILDEIGETPLPPYIKRDRAQESDRESYQTVYAGKPGAVAAPTAGLHFTEALLEGIRRKGTKIVTVTIHTGAGTFRAVEEDTVEEHSMESEFYEIGEDSSRVINERIPGSRIVAVGTTATRVLETAADEEGKLNAGSGWTDLFIYPGYGFKVIDSLITNFHPPRSTPIMLTCTFSGKDFLMEAYREAIEKKYRFYSYGDAMLIL